ncbi:MAG: hypothetical protein NTW21_12120 [Verrucomicrobia bacterium]|nr:hypothetical protein [Verrucomicrobiota bacterium]
MLRIRQTQTDALKEQVYLDFIKRLDAYLQSEVPEHRNIPQDERYQLIDALITIAGSYGLETEEHASIYVLSAWLCGFDFDERNPDVATRLGNANYTADEKSEWLTAWLEGQAKPS